MLDWDRYLVCRSSDPDEMQAAVSRTVSPHRLSLLTGHQSLRGRLDCVPFGSIVLVRLAHGAEVQVEPEELKKSYLIMVPAAGRAHVQVGWRTMRLRCSSAVVIGPDVRFRFRMNPEFVTFILRIDRVALEQFSASALDHPPGQRIDFEPFIQRRAAGGKHWDEVMTLLTCNEALVERARGHPLVASQLEHLILSLLVTTQPHTRVLCRQREVPSLSPYYLARAEEYMRAHLADALTLGRLAEVSGVSQRSLLHAFKRYRGTSPISMLRTLRLERVHALLSDPSEPSVSVTDTAFSWGFTHLGRFSRLYQRTYGELPSATLQKGRRRAAFSAADFSEP